jgi:peptidyl-prolyl cis-trans isomerase D
MFELLREKRVGKLAAKIILALLIIPFALFGVDYYQRGGGGDVVAEVGSYRVTRQEYEQAVRDRQEQMRSVLGRNFDPAILENPEVRRAILDDVINQRALAQRAAEYRLLVPDAELVSLIQGIEAFHKDGKFSKQQYEYVLRNQGMTPLGFEQRVRQQVMVQTLQDPLNAAAFVPRSVVDRMIAIGEQQREVSIARVTPDQFLEEAKIDPDAVKAYYDSNRKEFEVPEQVRLEYLTLSPDVLSKGLQVNPDEVKKYYEEHVREFGQPEERKASHILITVSANASDAERKAAREKAEDLTNQASKAPAKFADLAKEHSKDPGSASEGGDLGFFQRGAMVKPFEDAVFSMKKDEIRGPVESEFGFHIIKLTEIRPAKTLSLQEATPQIEQTLKQQKAGRKFAEVADSFSNLVYEQSDSLKPAADAFKLPVEKSDWIGRSGETAVFPATDKMLAAVFSDEVMKNKRNTEAIEVAPNTLVSARVLEYRPAAMRPFDEVKESIAKRLQRKQAVEAAAVKGKEALAKLQQGEESGLTWGDPQMVSRQRPGGLADGAVRLVFGASTAKLPTFVGLDLPGGGYQVVRISKVQDAPPPTDEQRKAYSEQLRQLVAQQQLAGYVKSARLEEGVKTRLDQIQKK